MAPKELKGKTPNKVMQATDGRRIEIYGQPSKELLAKAVCRVLVQRTLEEIDRKCGRC